MGLYWLSDTFFGSLQMHGCAAVLSCEFRAQLHTETFWVELSTAWLT